MSLSSAIQEGRVILPFRGHPSREHLTLSSDHNPTEDSESYLESPRAFSSTPNLQQVVVVPREQGKARRGMLFKNQFRVGKVGLHRSQTWPQHMSEKEDGSLSRAELDMQGYRPYKSAPSLRGQPFVHPAQLHGKAASLRRRDTWSPLSRESERRGYSPKYRIGSSLSIALDYSTGDPGPRQTGAPLIPRPNYDLEPLESIKRPEARLEGVPPFWESYNRMADFEDREFVKALGVNLDTLLIFAGLFSAVNTSFIIEALQTLQPDQTEKANDLLRSIILILQNSTSMDNSLRDEIFNTTPRAFRTTAIFFVSLTFSLTAAFGAVMGKQWLNYYEREGVLKSPLERGRERQRKFEARDKWHMEGVIETLPTLLQISLFLFLIALVDFLWTINIRLAYIVMAFSLVPTIFYISTTAIAVVYPISPFQTRLSISIRHLWSKLPTAKHLVATWNAIGDFVFSHLPDWQPPLGIICAICPALVIIIVHFLIAVPLAWLFKATQRLQRRISHFVPSLATSVPDSSSTNTDSSDILDVQCLNTYIQRASLPQDLTFLLTALSALPPEALKHVNHPAVKSLVELGLHRVVSACYSYKRDGKLASKIDIDFTCLLKILHLAYTSFGYGTRLVGKSLYLVSGDADHWILQELFDQLFQGSPDVESALMAIDLISHSGYTITWNEASLATLCQTLERPSNEPQNYLPYLTLLARATNHGINIAETQLRQILHALTSTMWTDGKPDLDYSRGALRLRLLPDRLGDDTDEYCFSEYLRRWREEGISRYGPHSYVFDAEYSAVLEKLLDSHPNHPFWLIQLEDDGHVRVLLDIMESTGNSCLKALYLFLKLWGRRRAIAPSGSPEGNSRLSRSLYLHSEGVNAILSAWNGMDTAAGSNWMQEVVNHTASYFEEANRLRLLGGHDLTKFVKSYKRLGNLTMPAGYQRESLYERIDTLTRTLVQPIHEAGDRAEGVFLSRLYSLPDSSSSSSFGSPFICRFGCS